MKVDFFETYVLGVFPKLGRRSGACLAFVFVVCFFFFISASLFKQTKNVVVWSNTLDFGFFPIEYPHSEYNMLDWKVQIGVS